MPILSSLSVLGAHFSSPPSGNWYDDASLDAAALNANLTGFADGTNGRFGYYYLNGVLGNFAYAEVTFINGLAYVNGSLFTGSVSWNGQTFINGRATTPFIGQG